jgi:hypothetical protein
MVAAPGARRGELATMLDAAAAHLEDAIDMLGRRSSGLSLGAAARHIDDGLAPVTELVRHARSEESPLPEPLRIAMSRLRTADLELAELSRGALSIVPPASERLDAQAILLGCWADSARTVAAWIVAGADMP